MFIGTKSTQRSISLTTVWKDPIHILMPKSLLRLDRLVASFIRLRMCSVNCMVLVIVFAILDLLNYL